MRMGRDTTTRRLAQASRLSKYKNPVASVAAGFSFVSRGTRSSR